MLRGWFEASGERREAAYLANLAALDREEVMPRAAPVTIAASRSSPLTGACSTKRSIGRG